MVELTNEAIPVASLSAKVIRPGCGGIVTFLGTVRDITDEEQTAALIYEAFEPMALQEMNLIEADVRRRWPVGEFVMIHRLGRVEIGEASVAVAVSCPHRREAFEACRYAIDRLKEAVPIWKKDIRSDGNAVWVHPEKAAEQQE